jgi:transposase
VGRRVLAPRLTGKRASMRHDEAPQTAQANSCTWVGYHDLDHRPAFTMAGPVTAAVPPNALRSWQRCFGSGRHGIHTRMARN